MNALGVDTGGALMRHVLMPPAFPGVFSLLREGEARRGFAFEGFVGDLLACLGRKGLGPGGGVGRFLVYGFRVIRPRAANIPERRLWTTTSFIIHYLRWQAATGFGGACPKWRLWAAKLPPWPTSLYEWCVNYSQSFCFELTIWPVSRRNESVKPPGVSAVLQHLDCSVAKRAFT